MKLKVVNHIFTINSWKMKDGFYETSPCKVGKVKGAKYSALLNVNSDCSLELKPAVLLKENEIKYFNILPGRDFEVCLKEMGIPKKQLPELKERWEKYNKQGVMVGKGNHIGVMIGVGEGNKIFVKQSPGDKNPIPHTNIQISQIAYELFEEEYFEEEEE